MAEELDELSDDKSSGGGSGILMLLLAIILAPILSAGATWFIIQMLMPHKEETHIVTEGGQPLDIEHTGEEKMYELSQLITNLGGPIKSRYIDVNITLEGLAGDFEKILEKNEYRMRDRALVVLGNYSYEDTQVDGFQERVRVDLKKGFSTVLKKYRDGDADLIRNLYFTQFVIQ